MTRDEAISRLQQHEADLKQLGVEHMYMFGSMARSEAKDGSDVDLFLDYEKEKLGLSELMDVKEYDASKGRPNIRASLPIGKASRPRWRPDHRCGDPPSRCRVCRSSRKQDSGQDRCLHQALGRDWHVPVAGLSQPRLRLLERTGCVHHRQRFAAKD